MIKEFIFEIFRFIGELNYWHVALLSALESTAFPVLIPVETVIIPMGYYAYLGTKNLSCLMFACTFGIIVGCLINYWFARTLGRTFIYKHSKLLHIKVEKLQRLEATFLKHSRLLMFVGRFIPIPAFKHIITLPAGMAKMPIAPFVFYNALGGFIFSTSMLLIGYFFGSSQELVHKAIGEFTVACIAVATTYIVAKIVLYLITKRNKRKSQEHSFNHVDLSQQYTSNKKFIKPKFLHRRSRFKNNKYLRRQVKSLFLFVKRRNNKQYFLFKRNNKQ